MSESFYRRPYVVVPYEVEIESLGRFILRYLDENPHRDLRARSVGSPKYLEFIVYGVSSTKEAWDRVNRFLSSVRQDYETARHQLKLLRMYLSSVRSSLDLDIPFVEEV